VIGAAVPFLLSIFSMLVSFDTGASVATILAPATLMADRWPDAIIPMVNGMLYGCIACAITLLPALRRR
jgi:hypothetical protein